MPTRNGNPNTARAPACSAAGVKTGHRRVTGSARSGSATTVSCRWASTHGPSPSVYCSSSITWLTSSLVHNDPRGISPDISMTPAPVTPAIPGHTSHSRAEDHAFPPADNSARIRSSLPPGIVSDTIPGRHPAGRTQPHDDRPPAASFARGNQTIRQEPGSTASRTQILITDATPPATPEAPARPPDIAQNGMTRSG